MFREFKSAEMFAAALGEVEQSMGESIGEKMRVEKYLSAFLRHRALKSEMEAYL